MPPVVDRTQDEAAFLATYNPAEFAPLAVAVDVVLMATKGRDLYTLLVRREDFPFKGRHALPGGFVGDDEPLDAAAARVCKDKAGLSDIYLEQLYTFGATDRDPRMRVVTVAYYALIDYPRFAAVAAKGPATIATVRVPWKGETGGIATAHAGEGPPLPLAFDHAAILGLAVKRLRGKLAYTPLATALVPPAFTLLALQHAHEAILGSTLNKAAFRRKILASGWLRPTRKAQSGVLHRPARLYTATAAARAMLARP